MLFYSEIMKEPCGDLYFFPLFVLIHFPEAGLKASCIPGIPGVSNGLSTMMERIRTARGTILLEGPQFFHQFIVQVDNLPFFILCFSGIEPNDSLAQVHLVHGQPRDLSLSPPIMVGKGNDRLEMRG